jgi:two-component system chemotaxis response regulator CheB
MRRDLVVIGASAGGVDTLVRLVSGLPRDLPAAVCVVLHIAPTSPSALAQILHRSGPLSCRQASDGDPLRPGEILVAPPDRHLVIEDNHVRLTVGPRENGHRPAVDTLFRSAASERDGRVIGVVLSGNRDDGTVGLAAIKARGGAAIVQDPDEALYAGMPSNALAHVTVDVVVPSEGLAGAITEMVQTNDPPPDESSGSEAEHPESWPISVCPECGGVLTEQPEAGILQWRCMVGHRYSPESLAAAQAVSVESALWAAIRALEERAALLERMADRCDTRGQKRSARSFRHKARDARAQGKVVREALSDAAESSLRQVSDDENLEAQAGPR